MNLPILSALLVGAFSLASVSQAAAWTRSGTVTTRRGTYSGQFSGGWAGGTCSRSATVTGPNGRTVSRTGSITHTGPGTYSYTRTTTGPNGNSITRSGTVTAYPYRYGY
jgi:hypothetical protein